VDAFLGGWQVNGITTFQTGALLLPTAANNSNAFSGGEGPDNKGTSALLGGSIIPGTGLSTPATFGVISGQANSLRQMQYGSKLWF
jgi:hypothetical protein